ncbi:MAG: hypothetical protein M3Z96_00480 [Pseudomonadota bacterium]|nr:hypothetical protein [Pseudomonadota bacterium]
MKDGSKHLAHKPEHAVDLNTCVIVAAPIHPADEGDTTTLDPTLEEPERSLSAVSLAATPEDPCDLPTRAIIRARFSKISTTAPGRRASPSPRTVGD